MNEELKNLLLEDKDCIIDKNGLAMFVINADNLSTAMEKFYYYSTIFDETKKEVRLAVAKAISQNAPELVLEMMRKHKQGDRGIIINWAAKKERENK